MPTVIYRKPESPITDTIEFFELSDSLSEPTIKAKKDCRLFAKLTIQDGKDIQIDISKDKGCSYSKVEEYSVTLIQEEPSHNGMVPYIIDAARADNPFFVDKNGDLKFPCAIYHRIKEFYHNHNFHKSDDGDSMIPPFVSREKVDIKAPDNAALLHYLEEYEKKFINGFSYLEHYFNKLCNSGFMSKPLFFIGWDDHTSFYMLAMRLKGDKAYFNTLCSSCYNSCFKMRDSLEDDAKEYRRKYFNIHNIIESIDAMEDRVNSRFSMSVARISFWIAIFAVVLSIVFYAITPTNS